VGGQLIPPPELDPPVPKDLTPAQCIEIWKDLMDTCERFLLAGLRREIGPDGDLEAAHRAWYEREMEEHDRDTLRMMERFNELWSNRGRIHGEDVADEPLPPTRDG
jgi:hypothetical protein